MTKCGKLMGDILRVDVGQRIHQVKVYAADNSPGFTAVIDFGMRDDGFIGQSITSIGSTPEKALEQTYRKLTAPCPQCGRSGPKPEKE